MPRVRNKGIRSQWTNERLESAITAVKNGMSKNAASQRYKISRRTLKRYLEKNLGEKVKMGRKTILNKDQEHELAKRIVRLAEIGYPLSNKIVRKCVFNYCVQNNLEHKFSQEKKMAGRYWMKGFLQRNREISIRKAQSMNPARAQKLNKFIVKDYFDKLKGVLQELDLMDKPERIYNIDEKGCRLSLHHQQTVLAKKGAKRVHLVAPEHGENITVVACANANGVAIPPGILFKGQRMKPEWTDNLPPGTLALMTPKGSMTVETFVIWLQHLAKYKLEGKCLLIFDGASCHLDHSIVDAAEQHNITLLCLPSNTTHELQPMDKSVFRSFEHHWDEQVLLFWTKYKDRVLTKQRFGEIFSIVWDKALTPANIRSGFRATGIFPYNPDAIPEVAFAPSILSEVVNEDPNGAESIIVRHKTPSPTPGCSYKNSPQKRCPEDPKKRNFKIKKTNTESCSSDSSGSYTSESEDSCEEIEFHLDQCHEKRVTPIIKKSGNERNSDLFHENKGDNSPQARTHLVEKTDPEEKKTNQKNDILNTSFTDMLETPAKIEKKKCANRKKAINSRAVVVKRDVFSTTSNDQKTQIDKGKKRTPSRPLVKNKKAGDVAEWFCKICRKAEIKDMRMCSICSKYVHEECVGLTKFDKELFTCPDCVD